MTFPSTRAPSPDMSDYPIGKPPMTPRERDPLVWAAAFGAAWANFYRIAYDASDGVPAERRRLALENTAAHVENITRIADAAALAARPEPPR
jgi:hypothetical protein